MSKTALLVLTVFSALATAAEAMPKLAVVAPREGNFAILGEQVRTGAALAAGEDFEIVEIDESCADGSGQAIGEDIATSGAVAAIGFLCTQSLDGALPKLAEARVPAITLSVRSSIIMEDSLKKGWPLFRLAPAPNAEREKIAEVIFENWKGKPFAILDDGTIGSRETAESVREALEFKGMKPAMVENFRPAQEVQTLLLRGLKKAGVTHVFAAADRADISVMARDARAAKLDLTFLGGDALNAAAQAVPLEKGVLAVTLPDYGTLPGAEPVRATLAKEDKAADGYTLPAYAAVEIVHAAHEIAGASDAGLAEALIDTPFETVIGELRFTDTHELAANPFVLLEWDGSAFVAPAGTQ